MEAILVPVVVSAVLSLSLSLLGERKRIIIIIIIIIIVVIVKSFVSGEETLDFWFR